MIIANLLGRTKLAIMNQTEADAWEASPPIDEDLILNSDTKSWQYYDGTAGSVVDVGTAVTTWKIDTTAPVGTSYYTNTDTIGHLVLLFALDGQMFRVVNGPATAANQVYHNIYTGVFELYISVTPAIQFNGEWLSIIYNNDTYPV